MRATGFDTAPSKWEDFSRSAIYLFVFLIGVMSLTVLGVHAASRALWLDESMAMANYPLSYIADALGPLPKYSQAAPPAFNALMTWLAPLDAPEVRVAMFALSTSIILGSVFAVYRSTLAVGIAAVLLVAMRTYVPLSTELKYYGLEFAASSIAAAWVLTKRPGSLFRARDVGILLVAAALGASTLVVSFCAFAAFLASSRFRLDRTGLLASAAYLIGLGALYIALRHATSVQMAAYAYAYKAFGVEGAISFLRAARGLPGLPYFLVAGASYALILVHAWRKPGTMRAFAVFVGAAIVAFVTLAAIGLYPASTTRHVAWCGALYVFAPLQAAMLLLNGRKVSLGALTSGGVVILVLWMRVLISGPDIPNRTETNKLMAWVQQQPPSMVGLWFGAQQALDYYEPRFSGLDKHEYFGRLNDASSFTKSDADLIKRAPSLSDTEMVDMIERRASGDGAYNRFSVYIERDDFLIPALSLIQRAPIGQKFLIISSFRNAGERDGIGGSLWTALVNALRQRNCTWNEAMRGINVYAISATCAGSK